MVNSVGDAITPVRVFEKLSNLQYGTYKLSPHALLQAPTGAPTPKKGKSFIRANGNY